MSNEFRDLARQRHRATAVRRRAAAARGSAAADSGAARADEGFWVAVLPFKYAGSNAELTALAEGLTEDIVTGLSRFSYLRVIARGSTAKYASQRGRLSRHRQRTRRALRDGRQPAPGGDQAAPCGAAGRRHTGAHLWAENYERAFSPENIFELQDDLVPRIVSTVADQHGVLPRSISEDCAARTTDDLTPHEAVLRAFIFPARQPRRTRDARRILERAVEQEPEPGRCLGDAGHHVRYGVCRRIQSPAQSSGASHGCGTTRSRSGSHQCPRLSRAGLPYFFRKDNAAFRAAVEQAIALNPMDGSVLGLLGLLVPTSARWSGGRRWSKRHAAQSPIIAGVPVPAFLNAYARASSRGA